MEQPIKYTHRYLARIVMEAATPLAVGSGERDVMTDRLVAADANGLPYIPGTALAGVLRNSLGNLKSQDKIEDLFGYQKGEDGRGSRLVVTSAHMVNHDGKVLDGLQNISFSDDFMAHFQNLPVRQHVRIMHKGSAEKGGKFDEQVVYKGTRFCFELELLGNDEDETFWKDILAEFSNPAFRIGGGTRKGFGAIRIEEVRNKILDLSNEANLECYLMKTSDLNDKFWESLADSKSAADILTGNWIKYQVNLAPDDFFLFGSGFGNEEGSADMSYVTERVIEWKHGRGEFTDRKVLIPATSVKGALAHRTAFHYNKSCKVYADSAGEQGFLKDLLSKGYRLPDHMEFDSKKPGDILTLIAEGNPAVRSLFGYSANDKDGQRGNVIFSDVHLSGEGQKKLLNHVSIDRFTGGAMDGALFTEEVTDGKEQFSLDILISGEEISNKEYIVAFEEALNDLCKGMLPLGGGTMRGHGSFNGKWTKTEGEPRNEN